MNHTVGRLALLVLLLAGSFGPVGSGQSSSLLVRQFQEFSVALQSIGPENADFKRPLGFEVRWRDGRIVNFSLTSEAANANRMLIDS